MMLTWLIIILVVALIAGLILSNDLALFAAGIARALVFLFLALFVVLHLLGRRPQQHRRNNRNLGASPAGRRFR